MLRPGQIFGAKYRVEAFLARGGFGAVYEAEQLQTELRVALKVLWPHVLDSPAAIETFQLEARVAGRIGSEHIVRVFDAGIDPDTSMPFLVMELLRGETLEEVSKRGPLAPVDVCTYFAQIARALEKAHNYADKAGQLRPIVHRDLKPANLFLARTEQGAPTIKILDFGIAKVISETVTGEREVLGTPVYMAPEQAEGGRCSPQTDIWALGLIGFTLLTGRSYWKAAQSTDARLAHLFAEMLAQPLEPASTRAALLGSPVTLPLAFDHWFSRSVAREACQRFASAEECAAALVDALGVSRKTTDVPAPNGRASLGDDPTANGAGEWLLETVADPVDAPELPDRTASLPIRRRSGAIAAMGAAAVLIGAWGVWQATRSPLQTQPANRSSVARTQPLVAGPSAASDVAPAPSGVPPAPSAAEPPLPAVSLTRPRPAAPARTSTSPAANAPAPSALRPATPRSLYRDR